MEKKNEPENIGGDDQLMHEFCHDNVNGKVELDEEEIEDEEVDDEEDEEDDIGGYDENVVGKECANHDESNNKVMVPLDEIKTIKTNLRLLNHQMALLLKAFNVKPCGCADCEIAQKMQNTSAIPNNEVGHFSNGIGPAKNHQQHQEHDVQKDHNASIEIEATQRGRRSKYCTPSEKKTVAEYVRNHGATAAGRKFNIPPAVAAYYHRREYKNKTSFANAIGQIAHLRQAGKIADSSSDGERMGEKSFLDESKGNTSQQMAQLWQNASAAGPHAYLRGRGRGRPKLIGDELDAELVEHIVKLKQENSATHLSAAQALTIARNYIAEKAPGILEEHGGQVKLKITWAMKLVTRVIEREREIQLGLPPGTLQNLPRSVMNSNDQSSSNASALVDELLNQQINVSAILAAANSADDSQDGTDNNNSADAAMLSAMLGIGTTANAGELFGFVDSQPGTSSKMRTAENTEANMEEQDSAIRQLLASLQGARSDQQDIDVAALAQISG